MNSQFLNLAPEVEYVGDEECVLCHSEIYNTFKETGMGRSFYPPSPENIIEDYLKNNTVYDKKSDLYYEMYQKGNDFYQGEYRLDERGKKIHELNKKVDFIVGSGNHNRTYLSNENGFIFEMPVTWYSEKKIWDLSPGYRKKNLRFSRPIVEECMNCHNSYTGLTEYSENHYGTDLPHGIGCERCHGPGQLHVEMRTRTKYDEQSSGIIDSTIVNPKHLPLDLQFHVCLQCHLQGDVTVVKVGKKDGDFRPGLLLTEVKSVFIRAGVESGDFRIASHGARIALSECFKQSAGKLVCTVCHNPHEPVQTLSREHFNGKCLNCHDIAALSKQPPHIAHKAGSDCVACHMTQGTTSDVLHVNFTDHWIRRKAKTFSKSQMDSLLQIREPVRLKCFFDEQDPGLDIRLGIAYVRFFEAKHADKNYLSRALPLLEDGLRDNPQHQNALYYLGLAYMHLGRLGDAKEQFEDLIRWNSGNALAYFQLGRILEKMEQLEHALAAYRKSLQSFQENAKAFNNMGNIYARTGRVEEGVKSYQQALKVQPNNANAHNNLGDLYLYQQSNIESGRKHLQRALYLNPDFVVALHNLGNLEFVSGEEHAALKLFQRIIDIDPKFVAAYGSIAAIYQRRGEMRKAKLYLNKLLEIDPANQAAMNMLRQLN